MLKILTFKRTKILRIHLPEFGWRAFYSVASSLTFHYLYSLTSRLLENSSLRQALSQSLQAQQEIPNCVSVKQKHVSQI